MGPDRKELERLADEILRPYFGVECEYLILSPSALRRAQRKEIPVGLNPARYEGKIMANAPKRICTYPGCNRIITRYYYCDEHRPVREPRKRGNDPRPSPVARGYGKEWRELRREYLQDHPYCATCGAPATDVHHIIPLRRGGTNDRDNLVALCHACHSRITAREAARKKREAVAQIMGGRGARENGDG